MAEALKSAFASCTKSGAPEKDEKVINVLAYLGVRGLHNSRNSCFMNSAIQCLSNTLPLLKFIMENTYVRDINYKYSTMKGKLITAFVEVLKYMWSRESVEKVIFLGTLTNEIGKIAPNFIGHTQQDAQEFLRLLLYGLHEELMRPINYLPMTRQVVSINLDDEAQAQVAWSQYHSMNPSKIVEIFVGQLKSVLKCCKCGHRSVTFETFWDLSLPLPDKSGKVTLKECLKLLTKKEKLEIICNKCTKQTKFHKKYSIVKLPKVLMIHLKRFKIHSPLMGSLNISLKFPINGWNLKKFSDCRGPYVYNLYAVCYHHGKIDSGHYTTCCKHPYTGEWHKFNDADVSKVSTEDLVNDNAYILFYELQEIF